MEGAPLNFGSRWMRPVGDAVETARPGFYVMISTSRKAKAFCAHFMHLMPADVPYLLMHVDATRCSEVASRYRLSAAESFPMYFQDAFRTTFANLFLLMGPAVESSEALGLVSRMLGKPPDFAAVQALDANVGHMLPHLNTATLRTANASVRIAEMETLVRTMLADNSTLKAACTHR